MSREVDSGRSGSFKVLVLVVATLGVVASCSDGTARRSDAGGAQASASGAGGSGAGAGAGGASARTDAGGGSGGSGGGAGGAGGAEAGPDGNNPMSHSGPTYCAQPLPDPGDDECLRCALDHCCTGDPDDPNDPVRGDLGAYCVAPPVGYRGEEGGFAAYCYEEYFVGCVQACFVARVADASAVSSWDVAADCADECTPREVGLGDGRFAGGLARCLLGDGFDSELDAGDEPGDDGGGGDWAPIPQSPCVEECFPGWQ